ncbi:hypothetical protein TIFTF001_001470 [Ficus carica]|uniref:Uncharacterized protein n=1 Tax=Ficus carica TaxID=3494 RepID=A0AA87ZI66_FICCA|nr:hypothetical protein TIFTF001_001470 [Ficus carica]
MFNNKMRSQTISNLDLRRRRLEIHELDPGFQLTHTSLIFDDVAVAVALKTSRMISVVGDSTFPSFENLIRAGKF